MRNFDLTPLYRSTVGFDRLASILDNVARSDGSASYPPYNIEKTGDDAYRITIAVAGFTDNELTIEARDGQLVIAGKKAEAEAKEKAETEAKEKAGHDKIEAEVREQLEKQKEIAAAKDKADAENSAPGIISGKFKAQ